MHRHARKMICGVFVFCAMSALMAQEQTFTVLGDFRQTVYGAATPLVQGRDGNFYGTTVEGISSPNCINQGGLVCGAIYRVTPGGKVTWLHQFCQDKDCTDGFDPGGLALGADGAFYGVAQSSFARDCKDTCGTIFKIEPNGRFTTLHTFTGPDGQHPIGTLVLGKDGNFYGTTYYGGTGTGGTIFKISPSGDLTTLHSFQFADGMHPTAALTLAMDGNFYGLTPYGGNHDCFSGCGTFFRMTPSGKFSVLHSFVPHTEGSTSTTGVVQAPDGNFYGSNSADALNQSGTVFG